MCGGWGWGEGRFQGLSEGLPRLHSHGLQGYALLITDTMTGGHRWVLGGPGLGAPAGQNLRPRLTQSEAGPVPAPSGLELHSSHGTEELAIRGQGTARAAPGSCEAPAGGWRLARTGAGTQWGLWTCRALGLWPAPPGVLTPRQAPHMVSSAAK